MLKFEMEITLATLFVRIGKTAQLWLEVGEWSGWKPCGSSGKGGKEFSWGWLKGSASR
jgi:hypothetical protein